MPISKLTVETRDVMSSVSSSEALATETPAGIMRTLPEFVKAFANEEEKLLLSRDSLRNMFNTLEKSELVEMLAMSAMLSPEVRSSIGYSLSNMTTFRRLLVRNIAFNSTTEEVKELLQSRYGLIEEGSVVYDRSTGKSKGFAFMTFAMVDSACNAIIDSDNGLIELQGRPILLKFAADRVDAINTSNRLSGDSVCNESIASTGTPASGGRRLFVSALAPETTSESLAFSMSAYGDMEECFVVSGTNGMSRRFGFVTFVYENSAWACLQQPVSVDGTLVSVQCAAKRSSSPETTPTRSASARSINTPMSKQPVSVNEMVTNILTGLDGDTLSALLGGYA
jgi:RNA recognition motif-containing protein